MAALKLALDFIFDCYLFEATTHRPYYMVFAFFCRGVFFQISILIIVEPLISFNNNNLKIDVIMRPVLAQGTKCECKRDWL